MLYQWEDVFQAAMLNRRFRFLMKDGLEVEGVLIGVGEAPMGGVQEGIVGRWVNDLRIIRDDRSEWRIRCDEIQELWPLDAREDDFQALREQTNALERRVAATNRADAMSLRKRFPGVWEALLSALDRPEWQGLREYLRIGGRADAQALALYREQLEAAGAHLSPEQEAMARYTLLRQSEPKNISAAMMAYLRHFQQGWTEDGVRRFALPLAVISLEARQSEPGFVFWMEEALRLDPALARSDEVLWIRYLHYCAVYQRFSMLRRALSGLQDRAEVYRALMYVLALCENSAEAVNALNCMRGRPGFHSPPEYFLFLLEADDAGVSYCVRYGQRVRLLIDRGLVGREDAGSIYECVFRDQRGYAIAVNGCLQNVRVENEGLGPVQPLLDRMRTQFIRRLDYDPELVVIQRGGLANRLLPWPPEGGETE